MDFTDLVSADNWSGKIPDVRFVSIELIVGILGWLAAGRVDYTGFFRTLTDAVSVGKPPWFEHWQARVGEGADRTAAARLMQQRNPIYIPRNHKVEEALRAAVKQNDLAPFRQLLNLVTQPYRHVPGMEEFEGERRHTYVRLSHA